jgi:hypothetical protein
VKRLIGHVSQQCRILRFNASHQNISLDL